MKRLIFLAAFSILVACSGRPENPSGMGADATQFEEGWPYTRAPNFPYGTWASASGYWIELRADNTYRVCLNGCDEGVYEQQGTVINLRDFNVPQKRVAQSLIASVNYGDWLGGTDLNFTPNMGPPANAQSCHARPCVQLGTSPAQAYIFILQE